MARTDAVLVEWTSIVPRNWRLFLVVFLVRIWRLNACERLMLPPARILKRLAAPLLVFILGMTTPQVMVVGVFLWKNLTTHTPLFIGTVCYIISTIPLLSKQLLLILP